MTNKLRVFRNEYLWLFLIVALGFIVRLYKIDNPVADWHSWRQADTASVTRIYLEKGFDLLHPRYQDISFLQTGIFNPEGFRFVEFPIFNAIHLVLVKVFPQYTLETWGRLLSVFCSLVSTALVFFIGRKSMGYSAGLVAAFFFAMMPYNIYFSRVILPEPMAVMFSLVALWLFLLWSENEKAPLLILSGISFALALLVKPYAGFYLVAIAWIVGNKSKWDIKNFVYNKGFLVFLFLSFAPLILWRFWIQHYPEGIPFYKWVFNSDGIRFKPSFWRWIIGDRLGRMMLGGWATPIFIFGLLSRGKGKALVLSLLLGMFLYVSTIATANVRHDYYQTLAVPAICLIVAKGFMRLWERKKMQVVVRTTVVLLVFLGLFSSWNDIKELYKINHPEIIRAGEALNQIAPKDALVVAPYNGDTAFLYQTKRSGWPYQTNSIEELVQKGAQYYVSVNLNDPQTQDAMRKYEISQQTEEYVIVDLTQHRQPGRKK